MLELAAHRPKTGTFCPYCYPLLCLHIISTRSTDVDVAVSDIDYLEMGFNQRKAQALEPLSNKVCACIASRLRPPETRSKIHFLQWIWS